MVPIKHILNETGVSEKFLLIVPVGNYAGTYQIKKMDGWNQVDSIIDINDVNFNVENFIIGETTKLKFAQFSDPETYKLIRNVYKEQGGDGRIIFKWIAEKAGIEYDLLGENFELNLNKYSNGFDKSKMLLELELIKSEAQNKLFTREDTTVDLFAVKDIDDNDITAVQTIDIGYKKGAKVLSNFYTFDISQVPDILDFRTDQFFCFRRSDDYEFGTNTNEFAGYQNFFLGVRMDKGTFVETDITLTGIKIEISNLRFLSWRSDNVVPDVSLIAIIKNGGTWTTIKPIVEHSSLFIEGGINYGEIKIDNVIFDLKDNLKPGQSLTFAVVSNNGVAFRMKAAQDNTSIEITTNMESPLVKTKAIRLIDGIDQLAKSYTSGDISAESYVLGSSGSFYNTSISTGMYLRGLPSIYLLQKIKTSIKSLLQDSASKLLALGYDVLNDKIIIEDVNYFFKDYKTYDLSEKSYLNEGYKIDHDKDIAYNSLLFGSKKYSTNVRFDIKNFNTTSETSTPIKSNKNKFDKQTDFIIDSYKIQELIEDKSTSTNDNDDDLVMIDLVEVTDVWDQGIFENCVHKNEGGFLQLECTVTAFDTTLIQTGNLVEITEGINKGNWTVLEIIDFKMKLNKTSGITEGVGDTPIRYKIDSLVKNRSQEGFTGIDGIRFPETSTNIRHNPKYQMARWFPFFGGGLMKKGNAELLKVTNYKNNSEAKMLINTPDMANELQGSVVVGADENLGRMRDSKPTFFNGENLEITYNRITFEEFLLIYNNWKFGENGDRTKSRGYLSCNTPEGILDVYPFGAAAFSHSKEKNTLSIKGKVKGLSVASPILLSVNQIDRENVTLVWDYSDDFINPSIRIQVSFDGFNWTTIKEVNNIKTDTVQSDLFNDLMTGDDVYFRVLVSSSELSSKSSNSIMIDWQFNDWTLKEITRTENINCGYSYLTLEIKGNVSLEFKWNFYSYPGGGASKAIDLLDNSEIISFTSPFGADYEEEEITTMTLDHETKNISIQLNNSKKSDTFQILNCASGDIEKFVSAILSIEVKNLTNLETTTIYLTADTLKKTRMSDIGET